ncbi:MAG: carboxypeptidase-like regulatory domain-containing protein [bacterium]
MASLLFRILFLLLLVTTSIGCGDTEEDTAAASLTIDPGSATIGVNQSQIFSVIAKSAVGTIVSVNATWSVTGGIGSINSSGLLTSGSSSGEGTVVATYGSVSDSAAVVVTDKGWIAGRVTNNIGSRVPDLKVFLHGYESSLYDFTRNTNNATASEPVGFYSISGITPGTYEVQTRDTGVYRQATEESTVSTGETTLVNLTVTYYIDPPDTNPPDFPTDDE